MEYKPYEIDILSQLNRLREMVLNSSAGMGFKKQILDAILGLKVEVLRGVYERNIEELSDFDKEALSPSPTNLASYNTMPPKGAKDPWLDEMVMRFKGLGFEHEHCTCNYILLKHRYANFKVHIHPALEVIELHPDKIRRSEYPKLDKVQRFSEKYQLNWDWLESMTQPISPGLPESN